MIDKWLDLSQIYALYIFAALLRIQFWLNITGFLVESSSGSTKLSKGIRFTDPIHYGTILVFLLQFFLIWFCSVFESLTLRCAWTGDSRNFLTVQVGSVALHLLEILKPVFFKFLHWTVVKHISFHLGVLYSSIAQLVESVLFLFLT